MAVAIQPILIQHALGPVIRHKYGRMCDTPPFPYLLRKCRCGLTAEVAPSTLFI